VKRYDKAYFDKWYRRLRVNAPSEVRRKVALAVAETEYFLARTLRDVLDVGCGEGAWREHLRALRPRVRYLGVDPSDYVAETFGRARNIRKAAFGELASLRIDHQFDLVVSSDAIHYVPDDELRRGLPALVQLAGGIVFLDLLTAEDDIVGDVEGLIRRPAAWYRKLFHEQGLLPVGAYTWAAPPLHASLSELERGSGLHF
jgi:SAM-dependent methyltransferase